MKKKFGILITIIATVAFILSACSTKKDSTSKSSYKTEDYLAMSAAEQAKVKFLVEATREKNKVFFNLKISNKNKSAVEFTWERLELDADNVYSASKPKLVIKPNSNKTYKKLFRMDNFNDLNGFPELTYKGKKLSNVSMETDDSELSKILLKTDKNSSTSDNQASSSSKEQSSTAAVKDINSITDADWIPGIAKEIQGKYVGYFKPDEKALWNLTLTDDKLRLDPHAEIDSLGIEKVKFVKLSTNQYLLKGQWIAGTVFYYKVTLQDNGNLILASAQETPDKLVDDGTFTPIK